MSKRDAASSSAGTADVENHRRRPNEEDAPNAPDSTPQQEGETSGNDGQGPDMARCPICQFIEAGDCKKQHQDWVACRDEAKAAGKEYIDECQEHFKTFLQCALEHRDYYEPFLEMLGGVPGGDDDEEEGREEEKGQEGQSAAEREQAAQGGSASAPPAAASR